MENSCGQLFIDSKNQTSQRLAIFEECDGDGWLYLTEAGGIDAEKKAFAYSSKEPFPTQSAKRVRDGDHYVLTYDCASGNSFISNVKRSDISFMWADEGESLALILRGKIQAMILREDKDGHSLALSKTGLLGKPLDKVKAERFYAKQG